VKCYVVIEWDVVVEFECVVVRCDIVVAVKCDISDVECDVFGAVECNVVIAVCAVECVVAIEYDDVVAVGALRAAGGVCDSESEWRAAEAGAGESQGPRAEKFKHQSAAQFPKQ